MFASKNSTRLKEMQRISVEVSVCTKCELSRARSNPVVGSGNLGSKIVLVGEAPGRKEDELGSPFVGSAGKLLDKLLCEAGLNRDSLFITNIVKCRPPNNRRPKKSEIRSCEPYLYNQLRVIKPEIIAPMGNSSVSFFFDHYNLGKAAIGDVHGKKYLVNEDWGPVSVIPLYHPAAAIYNRRLLEELTQDMKTLASLKVS